MDVETDASNEDEDIKTAGSQKQSLAEKENVVDTTEVKPTCDAGLKRRLSVREQAAAFLEVSVKDTTY
jgi:hypothetical protein